MSGGWADDDDWTEPPEGEGKPLMGVTGGERARPGDHYTLFFDSDGEEVDTENGSAIAFDAEVRGVSFQAVDGDGDVIEVDDEVRFMTSSSRLLAKLSEFDPVGGKTLRVNIDDVGKQAAYTVESPE